jgi:O-antigen ligase
MGICGLAWRNAFVLSRGRGVLVIVVGVVAMGIALATGAWIGIFKMAGYDAYLDDNTASRIGSSFLDQSDESSVSRRMVADAGLQMAAQRPLFGWGIGATQRPATELAPHNLYVLEAVEFGCVGVVVFLSLIVVMWRRRSERSWIFAPMYAVAALFTHNNLELPAVMLAVALAMASFDEDDHDRDGGSAAWAGPPRVNWVT